jgi:hypothetical protein
VLNFFHVLLLIMARSELRDEVNFCGITALLLLLLLLLLTDRVLVKGWHCPP